MSRVGWLGLLLVLVALAGCEGTQAPPDQNRPADVDVSLPVKDTLRDYEVFTGRTQALNAVDLRARVTGYLAEVRFKEGQDVKKGDVLFVIQQDPFRDALAQSEATLSQQQAQLKYNEAIYQRNRILVGRQGVSQEDLEQSRANRDQYIAGVSGAEAAIKIARQNLQWTEIRAPFDGRISRRQVDPGNDVIADNTVLASLVELDKLYAYFDVDERTLLRINALHLLPEGMIPPDAADKLPVTLGLANEKPEDFSHPGRLQFADNKVDPNTGTLRVWGTFENPRRDLKPGLFIRVRMGIGDPQPTFFVAEKALGYDQGRKYLYVVKQEQKEDGTHDTVTYVPVEAGQRKYVPGVGPGDPGGVLIAVKAINKADQLKGDERIVVEGLQRIRPHMDVVAHVVPMPRAKAEGQGEASDSH